MSKTGTIKLPTASAVALFQKELKGQMSDGMWENSRPWEHWKFWSRMDVQHVPGCVPTVETTVSRDEDGADVPVGAYEQERQEVPGRLNYAGE